MSDYGIAHLCLTGHLVTSKSNDTALKQNFCSVCGETIISCCQECNTPIKGSYREVSQITPPFRYSNLPYIKPLYCCNCGEAFPWTKQTQETVIDLISSVDDLDANEKDDFKQSVMDLIKDSPKISIAQIKFKKYSAKAGNEVAKGLKEILVDMVSEAVKKTLWSN